MHPILELQQVTKQYGSARVVDGVSLSIERGSLFSLVGPSGCGKTTTLRMIAGFDAPTSGDILLKGRRINSLRPYQRNVTTVFQNYALFPHLTVAANIEFGLRQQRSTDIARRVRDVLELVRLEGKESRLPSQLSGGEKQRVALARSLVLAPDVLLLDEPLSALDPLLRKQVRTELRSLQRRVGITFLLVTHDQEEALSISDRMAVMNQGRIEQVGSPRELYLQPRTRFAAAFLGAINWIDGIGVRPELVRLTREAPGNDVRCQMATVRHAVFLGNCVQVECLLARGGEPVTSEVPCGNGEFKPGEGVHAWWRPEDEVVVEE